MYCVKSRGTKLGEYFKVGRWQCMKWKNFSSKRFEMSNNLRDRIVMPFAKMENEQLGILL